MNTSMRLLFLLGLFTLLLPSALVAQAERDELPQLRFLFLDESEGAYVIKTGATYRQISSTPYAISSSFTPETREPLEVYKTLPATPGSEKPTRVKIATIPLPTTSNSALFIITPRPPPAGSTGLEEYTVETINNDASAAPPGSLRILNRGKATMAAQIGTETVISEPGETRIFKPTTDDRYRVRIKIATPDDEGWKLLDDRIVKVRAGSRMTGIFVFSPSGLRYTYPPDELFENGPPPPGHFWLTYTDTP